MLPAWTSPGVGSSGEDELRQDAGGFRGGSALAGTGSPCLTHRREQKRSPDAGSPPSESAHCPSSEGKKALLNSAARAARLTAENDSVADRMSTREAERVLLPGQDSTLLSCNTALSSASPQSIDSSAIPIVAGPILSSRQTELVAAMSGSVPPSQQASCDLGQPPDLLR
jgi:hypothetical protein